MIKLIFRLLTLSIFFFSATISYALVFNETRITDNNRWDYGNTLFDKTVAWYANGLGVLLWDGNATIQVASGGSNAMPSLWNRTIAFWSYVDPPYDAIFYYNGTTTTRITDNSLFSNRYPSLYDGKIAWTALDRDRKQNIYYWDGNNVTQITNTGNSHSPSLYNGTIAWIQKTGSYLGEIRYWDGNTIQTISNCTFDISYREISLHDGKIAWSYGDPQDKNTWEIYIWDGTKTIRLTNNDRMDFGPSIYDGKVVWTSGDYNDQSTWEIYYWDGENIFQVTNNNIKDEFAHIHQRSISWDAKIDDSNYEIFIAELSISNPDTNINDGDIDIPIQISITAKFLDNIDPETVNIDSFFITGVPGTVAFDTVQKTATFTPIAALNHVTTYTAIISSEIRDLSGNQLHSDISLSFTTVSAPDEDTDDDGIPNAEEDVNNNGMVDAGETDPQQNDSDGDGIQDGTEIGLTLNDVGYFTNLDLFRPDHDPSTSTNPLNPDTDADGINDGQEDKNADGKVDAGETDPTSPHKPGGFYVIPNLDGGAAIIYLK